ncbi:hypothetical protein ColLi_05705 [Colletotrichum liriopes]|uniref:Prolyl 4-hydroxylase alpha subunit domain-containing protein n=1 Tax=Colletotrichum liriopes TaxID=708192 RepID=A0AA37GLC3_9PEZI|nr:hypothetical protein ColLi_05705 [Colletotrichum liriopes]
MALSFRVMREIESGSLQVRSSEAPQHLASLCPNKKLRNEDDDSNNVSLTLDPSTGPVTCKTTWTLLLYLTSSAEGCAGGETVFFPNDRRSAKEEIPVALETGMLLLHKHGDDCMLHEGREVAAGEKWVLRTDLCVRK